MRSLNFSNTAKPSRPVCPRCGKKGIGVWHRPTVDSTMRDRSCRYCNYTEFQTYVFGREFRGEWLTTAADVERQNSYNGTKDQKETT